MTWIDFCQQKKKVVILFLKLLMQCRNKKKFWILMFKHFFFCCKFLQFYSIFMKKIFLLLLFAILTILGLGFNNWFYCHARRRKDYPPDRAQTFLFSWTSTHLKNIFKNEFNVKKRHQGEESTPEHYSFLLYKQGIY